MKCKICHLKFKTLNNYLLLSDIFSHSKNHSKQEKLNCDYNTELCCQKGRALGSIDELLHNFTFHTCNGNEKLQVFQNLLTKDEGCSRSPVKKNQVTFETRSDQDVQNNEQTNYGDNGQNFRAMTNENDDIGLFETKHMGQFVCTNEKHSIPIVFVMNYC